MRGACVGVGVMVVVASVLLGALWFSFFKFLDVFVYSPLLCVFFI